MHGRGKSPRIPRWGGIPIVDEGEKDVDLRLMAQYVVSNGDNTVSGTRFELPTSK